MPGMDFSMILQVDIMTLKDLESLQIVPKMLFVIELTSFISLFPE